MWIIVLLEIQPRPSCSFLAIAIRFSFKIFLYFLVAMMPRMLTGFLWHLLEKQSHNITNPPPSSWDEDRFWITILTFVPNQARVPKPSIFVSVPVEDPTASLKLQALMFVVRWKKMLSFDTASQFSEMEVVSDCSVQDLMTPKCYHFLQISNLEEFFCLTDHPPHSHGAKYSCVLFQAVSLQLQLL